MWDSGAWTILPCGVVLGSKVVGVYIELCMWR
jgi:hypothetical protein